jgi:hypothetical protein
MKQYEFRKGNRVVVIYEDSENHTRFHARLSLNNGATASLQCWKGKTRKGVEVWAQRMLNPAS